MTRAAGTGPHRERWSPLPWHRRLGVRIAAALAALWMAVELLRVPLQNFVASRFGENPWTRLGVPVVLAVAAAVAVAVVLSSWLARRLAHLSPAIDPEDPEALPGPFDVAGEDEIARVAATMNSMRDRVEERLRGLALNDIRRREWIAQVSHDLRTPLTAQLACFDRAQSILQKPDSQLRRNELQELLAVAKADADRVHTLADDLLEIARLEAGDRLRLEPVPPGELIRQAASSLEPLAAKKGIRLTVNVTARLPVLHADGRRLTRAIENLLRNAIQHGRSEVEIRAVRSGACVRFEVRDNGAGLPKQPDFLDFLRRRGGDVWLSEISRRRRPGDSAGLGLVVAHRVAHAHNGAVDAYNLSSGGAAFWIDIPVPAEDPSLVEDAAAP